MTELTIKEIQALQLKAICVINEFCKRHKITYYLISGSCLGAVRHNGFIPWDDDIDIALMRDDYERFIELFNKEISKEQYFLTNEFIEDEFIPSLSRIIIQGTKLENPALEHLNICKGMFLDVFPLDNVPDDKNEIEKQKRDLIRVNNIIAKKVFARSIGQYAIIKNFVKKLRSYCYCFISLKKLKERRKRIITRYQDKDTQCVSSMASKYGYSKHIMPRVIYGIPRIMNFEGIKLPFPEKSEEHLTKLFGKNYMAIPPEEKREKPSRAYKI